MSTELANTIFLLCIVVAVTVYDVVVINKKGKQASLSGWAIRTSYKYPSVVFIFAFGLGFVMGHLFWNMNPRDIWDKHSKEIKEICKDVNYDLHKS